METDKNKASETNVENESIENVPKETQSSDNAEDVNNEAGLSVKKVKEPKVRPAVIIVLLVAFLAAVIYVLMSPTVKKKYPENSGPYRKIDTEEIFDDTISENLETLDYGDYVALNCNNLNDLKYSGYLPGDKVRCSMRFSGSLDKGSDSSDVSVNYIRELSFDYTSSDDVRVESVSFIDSIYSSGSNYEYINENNKITIRRDKADFESGQVSFSNIGRNNFLEFTLVFSEVTGFENTFIRLSNFYYNTGGNNGVFEPTDENEAGEILSLVAKYDPESINDYEEKFYMTTDEYTLQDTYNNEIVFYKNNGKTFEEIKRVHCAEYCAVDSSTFDSPEENKIILPVEGDSADEVVYVLYDYAGNPISYYTTVYFSWVVANQSDGRLFVGNEVGSSEWAIYKFDGTMVRTVDPEKFVFVENRTTPITLLMNFDEL